MTVTFDDLGMPVTTGSMKYRLLIAADGKYRQVNPDLTFSSTQDRIQVVLKPGTYSNKQTVVGLHGMIINGTTVGGSGVIPELDHGDPYFYGWLNLNNGWTNARQNEYGLNETAESFYYQFNNRYTQYQFPVGNWIHDVYNKYDNVTRQPTNPATIDEIVFNPSTRVFSPRRFEYVYGSSADFNGYMNGSALGDGDLDLSMTLEFDQSPLFSSKRLKMDGSSQPERLPLSPVSGNTTNSVAGVASDLFTQGNDAVTGAANAGTYTQTVPSAGSGGTCHTIKLNMLEYDTKATSASQRAPMRGWYKVELCPDTTVGAPAGQWKVSYGDEISWALGAQQSAPLLPANVNFLSLPISFIWSGWTTDATVNTTMEIHMP